MKRKGALAVCGCLAIAGITVGRGQGSSSTHRLLSARHNGLLAFTRDDDVADVSRLWTVAPTGEQERTLTTAPGIAEGAEGWSRDGKTLVFTRSYVNADAIKVVLAAPDGSNAREIADGEAPVLSPGGRWVALEKPNYELFVVRRNGTGLRRISPRGSDVEGADWSPDGTRIVFGAVSDSASKTGVFVIGLDGRGLRRVSRHEPFSQPAWSPDGKSIAFSFDTKRWAYAISTRVDAPSSTILARFRRHQELGDFDTLTWSPDARWVAIDYVLEPPFAVYTVRSDGRGLKRVSRPGPQASDPCWSPDGRFIVYDTFTPDHSGLEIVKARGGFVRRIAESPSITTGPVWQPLP